MRHITTLTVRPVHLARDLVRKGLSSITNRATDGGESLSPAENQQRRLAMKDASTQLQSYYAAFKEEKRWRYRVEDAKNPKENMTGELPTADYEWDKSKTRLRTERKPTESSINTVSRYSTYREDLTANLKKRGAKSDIVEAMWKDLGYEAKVDEPLSEKNSEA